MPKILDQLLSKTKTRMSKFKDVRKPSNAMKYSMETVGMGALSVFIMQDPSFLSQQERLGNKSGMHNFETLFGCKEIPTPNHIRNLLDQVSPAECERIYHDGLEVLEQEGGLKKFQFLKDSYLIGLDGTEHYSSKSLHCNNCTVKTHGGIPTYSHSVLCASILSPGINEAIPLVPEFITPQDGHDKQDCENAAFKRWISKHGKTYKHLNPTILGDDLFSRQSLCKAMLKEHCNFILTCKPESHKTLYEYLSGVKLEKYNLILKKNYRKYLYQYKFLNQVPIRDGEDALLVNWLQITQIDAKSGKKIYSNSFITNHHIYSENVHDLAAAGRARWKLENENNNTLKTKGYCFEHNYGHGKQNLCKILASLTVIAFLFHTVISIVDTLYLKARLKKRTRINFFNFIKCITSLIIFSSWDKLFLFISDPPDIGQTLGEF